MMNDYGRNCRCYGRSSAETRRLQMKQRAEFRKDYSGIVFDEIHSDAQLVDGDEE